MSDLLADFLASILQAEGCPNPGQVAAKAAADLRRARLVDQWALLRAQIQADPCRDYKVIKARYGCPVSFIYRVWNERGSGASLS